MLAACVLLTAVTVAYVFQSGRTEALLQRSGDQLADHVRHVSEHVTDIIGTMESELRFLADAPPIQGLIRARADGGVDPWDGSTESDWQERLEDIFVAFLQSHPEFVQASLIGVQDGGLEIERVERSNGRVRAVPGLERRRHAGHDDFRLASFASPGTVILAPLDKVDGTVAQQLSLRLVTPVHGPAGELFGILVLQRVLAASSIGDLDALPDGVGFYLMTTAGDRLFATAAGVSQATPDLWSQVAAFSRDDREDKLILSRPYSGEDTWYLHRVALPHVQPVQDLVMVMRAPYAVVAADAESALQKSVRVTVLLVLMAVLTGILLGRRVTAPLGRLLAAVFLFRQGQRDLDLPTEARGEFGLLARAFADMAAEVQRRETSLESLNAHLEDRVQQRSADLQQLAFSLQEQAELFNMVLDNVIEGVIVADGEGNCRIFNRAARRILGRGPTARPLGCADLSGALQPDGETPFPAAAMPMAQALAGVNQDDVDMAVRHPGNGTLIRLRVSGRSLRDRHGKLCGGVVTFRDVTEQYSAELEQRLAALVFDHSAQGIVVTDSERRILKVNQAFSKITGYRPAEVLGRDPALLQSGVQGQGFYDHLWESIARDGFWEGELWNRRCNGETYAEHLSIIAVKPEVGGPSHYVGMFSDITERKRTEEQVYRLAHYDALSGLPNRLLFKDRLQHAIDRARRGKGQVAVLFIDLDRFKPVNDTFGHAAGDQVLLEVARRLAAAARESDTVARFGGDEFAVALEEVDRNQAERAAERLLEVLRRPIPVHDQYVHLGASIGISMYPEDGEDADNLLQFSDLAMYRVKEQGRNGVCFFRAELSDIPGRRLRLEQQLREAIAADALEVYYQPQVAIDDGRIQGAEALVRWRQDDGSWISPVDFIPVAEDSGLIQALGEWVLRTACRQRAAWAGLVPDDFRLAVNVSPRQLEFDGLAQRVIDTLALTGVAPAQIELEITENALMRDPTQARAFLERLSQHGVSIAMDDFGSGYSSLAYLKRFPIDRLKVDRAFVHDLPHDSDDCAIARTVVAMAHSLRLQVTAEGVENAAQLQFLADNGCDEFQGYYCCPPRTAAELEPLLRQGYWRPLPAPPLASQA